MVVRDACARPRDFSEPGRCRVGVQAWVVVTETGCMMLYITLDPKLEVELEAKLGNRAETGTRNRRAWSE